MFITNSVGGPESAPYLPKSGSTMTGALILHTSSPSTDLEAASKGYVDSQTTGLNLQPACYVATTAILSATYDNGTAGVGATLTNNAAMAAFSVDGVSPPINSRVLVKNQSSMVQNGIYTLTTVGDGSTNWVLTRSTDFDQPSDIVAGDIVFVTTGTANSATAWLQQSDVTTIGSDNITFSQINSVSYAKKGVNTDITSLNGVTGTINLLVDGTAVGSAGSINLGAGTDAGLYVDSSNEFFIENVNSDVTLRSGSDVFKFENTGGSTVYASISSASINLNNGMSYNIGGSNLLNETTLGSSVLTSSLTTVGALDAGSITSNFGNIDIGTSSIDAGTITSSLSIIENSGSEAELQFYNPSGISGQKRSRITHDVSTNSIKYSVVNDAQTVKNDYFRCSLDGTHGRIKDIKSISSFTITFEISGGNKFRIDSSGVRLDDQMNCNNQDVINLVDPTNPQDAATKNYVDTTLSGSYMPLSGGVFTGAISMEYTTPTIGWYDASVALDEKRWGIGTNGGDFRIWGIDDAQVGGDNLCLDFRRNGAGVDRIRLMTGTGGGTARLTVEASTITAAAALAMGSNQITGLAAGASADHAVRYDQVPKLIESNTFARTTNNNNITKFSASGSATKVDLEMDTSGCSSTPANEGIATLSHRFWTTNTRTMILSGNSPFPQCFYADRSGAEWSSVTLNASLAVTGICRFQVAATTVMQIAASGITANQTINMASTKGINGNASTFVNCAAGSDLDLSVGGVTYLKCDDTGTDRVEFFKEVSINGQDMNGVNSLTFYTGSQTALDTYYEASWFPVMGDGTNNFTMSAQTGDFTRIGNSVSAHITVSWSSIGSASGAIQLTLSHTLASDAVCSVSCNGITNGQNVICRGAAGNSYINFYELSSGSPTILTESAFASSGSVVLTIVYAV